MKEIFLFNVLLLITSVSAASTLEGFAGANYTRYDEVPEASVGGLSVRFKYNHSLDGADYFFYNSWNGGGVGNFDALLGYSYRSKGNLFLEVGAGGFYGAFGPGLGVIAGAGFWPGPDFYFSMPILYRAMGLSYITISPMIGWKF